MKHTIQTATGRFTVEPAEVGVQVKFKPIIWPEVGMILTLDQADMLAAAIKFATVDEDAPS